MLHQMFTFKEIAMYTKTAFAVLFGLPYSQLTEFLILVEYILINADINLYL